MVIDLAILGSIRLSEVNFGVVEVSPLEAVQVSLVLLSLCDVVTFILEQAHLSRILIDLVATFKPVVVHYFTANFVIILFPCLFTQESF